MTRTAAAQAGRIEAGIAHLRRAIAINPHEAKFHFNLGIALMQLDRLDEALASLNHCLALAPDFAPARYNHGVILLKLNRLEQAVVSLEQTLKLQPDFADAYNNLGFALTLMKRHEKALVAYQSALKLQPEALPSLYNVALTLCSLRRHNEALPFIDKALRLSPEDQAIRPVQVQALLGLNRAREALTAIDAVLAVHPHDVKAKILRASALTRLHQPEDALRQLERIPSDAADTGLMHLAYAQTLRELNRHEEALASFNAALQRDPEDTEAIWDRALILLTLGRFAEGWSAYEARFRIPEIFQARRYPQPLWLGQDAIEKKRLFVYWEQGLGDTIQFARYVRMAAAAGAEVVFSVQDPLRRLFKNMGPNIRVIGQTETPSTFDLHCPLLSMPRGFATRLETIPSIPRDYLTVAEEDVAAWRQKLPAGRRCIGLVWCGNPKHINDFNRSAPLAQLKVLAQTGHTLVSLQKDVREADRAALEGFGLLDLTAELQDFTDTAALISALDLVISVDTSVAHLAGALGKPCWVMLPFVPDFRWLLDREDSPWYPTMRLFRQQRPGDWEGVAARILAALSDTPF